jgi:hypothetical protein
VYSLVAGDVRGQQNPQGEEAGGPRHGHGAVDVARNLRGAALEIDRNGVALDCDGYRDPEIVVRLAVSLDLADRLKFAVIEPSDEVAGAPLSVGDDFVEGRVHCFQAASFDELFEAGGGEPVGG